MSELTKPILSEGKCSVMIDEIATGVVYKKDLKLYLEGDNPNDVFHLFDNFDAAQEFARDLVRRKPEFECLISNHNGQLLVICSTYGETKYPVKN